MKKYWVYTRKRAYYNDSKDFTITGSNKTIARKKAIIKLKQELNKGYRDKAIITKLIEIKK